MINKFFIYAIMLMLCIISSQMVFGAQPGKTETVFNKRFIQKVKPLMPYEQLVKLIGAPGAVIRGAGGASPQIIRYHWDGGKKSTLDARFSTGKLVNATMLAPNGNSYPIGK